MKSLTMSPELSHPAYEQAFRLKGYSGKITLFQAVSTADAAKVLKQANPNWTAQDHKRLSQQHAEAAAKYEVEWGQLANEAALQTFGRPYSIFDYKVSGIASEEFPDEFKEKLRFAAHAKSHHTTASRAHEHAARIRRRATT